MVTALPFNSPTIESVLDAIKRLESIDADPHTIALAAERFAVERFHCAMRATWAAARNGAPRHRQPPAGTEACILAMMYQCKLLVEQLTSTRDQAFSAELGLCLLERHVRRGEDQVGPEHLVIGDRLAV